MPGTLLQELLNGGLVTKRHATMLEEGELQQTDDCVYRRFDPSIHIAPARTLYNSTALSDLKVKGLAHLAFDEGNDALVTYSGTGLQLSDFTALSTATAFSTMQGSATLQNDGDETMQAVYFGGAYYAFLSANLPQRIARLRTTESVFASGNITISGTTTLTTATPNGFSNVLIGQAVSWSGVTGAPVVTAKTSNTVVVISVAQSNATPLNQIVTFSASSLTQVQQMGLFPVDKFHAAQVVLNASASWNSALGNGTYWFLVTEMYMPGAVDDASTGFMESAFTASPQKATITNYAAQSVTITHGTSTYPFVNSVANSRFAATHWQIYMSDKMSNATDKPSLAVYTRVGPPIPVSTTSRDLRDDQTNSGPKVATTNAAFGSKPQFSTPIGAYSPNDGSAASSSSDEAAIVLGGFAITGSGTVQGVMVKVYASSIPGPNAGAAKYTVRLRNNTGSNYSISRQGTAGAIGNVHGGTYYDRDEYGGEFDTWGYSTNISDYASGTFEVVIERIDQASVTTMKLDGVEVTVFLTGTTVNKNGVPLRTVTYRSEVGTTVTDVANLPPPIGSTADVFQGSIVTNSKDVRNAILYSLPGTATSWPRPYRMVFQSRRKDEVTFIRTLGQVLVVGMRDGIKRVNYLPTELDTDFGSGLAHEDLATDHGVVGPEAGVLFDLPNAGPMLAYVAYNGLHVTDGVTTRYLNIDLDWTATVDMANLDSCILRNYPQENWLVLFYAPYGTSHGKNTRALVFPYSPDHIKQGNHLKAVGPFKVSARSACTATLNGRTYLLTGHEALGKVYVEDQGLTLPSGYTVANAAGTEAAITIIPVIKTRRIYPHGIAGQAREQRVYVMADAFGATVSPTGDVTSGSTTIADVDPTGLLAGMLVTGSGIQPDTVITAVGANTLTISRAANATGADIALTCSSGTLGLTVSGQNRGEALTDLETVYQSTQTGGLMRYDPDNVMESFQLTLSKVNLPASASAALEVGLRLHYFAYLANEAGSEKSRA